MEFSQIVLVVISQGGYDSPVARRINQRDRRTGVIKDGNGISRIKGEIVYHVGVAGNCKNNLLLLPGTYGKKKGTAIGCAVVYLLSARLDLSDDTAYG